VARLDPASAKALAKQLPTWSPVATDRAFRLRGTSSGRPTLRGVGIVGIGTKALARLNPAARSPAPFPWVTLSFMAIPTQPNIKLVNAPDYREQYANSVQIRVNVWDFFLVFGTLQQQNEREVEVRNFQGVYLSPQQAKALLNVLQQNVVSYEKTFGEIKLDPQMTQVGMPN
jgi:Protein of unknown function (DUF3467)